MKNIIATFLLLFSFSSWAQGVPYAQNFGNTCPGGSSFCQDPVPHKIIFFDFTAGTLPSSMAFSRASPAWYFDNTGILQQADVNVPRFDYGFPGNTSFIGFLVEDVSTNMALWSRNLSHSPWIATNAVAATDQIGIDGLADSASSVVATSSNATVCQAISHASAPAVFSVYLKRISGSGTISISQDSGATYATQVLSGSWGRFIHSAQSVLNPSLCIKIATSGNKIGVDIAQFEYPSASAGFVTSPIITTSTTVTRAADSAIISPIPWYNPRGGAYVLQYQQQNFNTAVVSFSSFNNSGYSTGVNNGNTQVSANNCFTSLKGPSSSATNKLGGTYIAPGGMFACANNGSSKAISRAIPLLPTTLNFTHGWIQKFTYWNYKLTQLQLQGQTR